MNPYLCRKALTIPVRAFFISSVLFSCQQLAVELNAFAHERRTISQVRPEIDEAASQELVVSFVGDVIIHDRLRKREEAVREGFRAIWAPMQPLIDLADTSYANLEGPVAPDLGGPSGFPHFNFPEEIIIELKSAGFDIVSTANNHSLDKQSLGIKKTVENLNKHSLSYMGTISSESAVAAKKEAWWGLTAIKNTSLKLAWIACTEMTNGKKDLEGQVLYCFKNEEKIKALIQELKQHSEIAGIVVTPHWGEEEKFDINPKRRTWAQQIIDQGALAVVGSHPHVIQKLENYTAKDGRKSFIAYSLGNFVSNQPWLPNRTSMILFTKFQLNQNRRLLVNDVKYVPLWMVRTIEKDTTAKYRIYPVWEFNKLPSEAVKIWKDQLTLERRFKSLEEVKKFIQP